MRKKIALLCALTALPAIGCAYGDITAHDNGKLYVARQGFFFGALRKFYECTPSGSGSITCVAVDEKP
jgi:hypothetical protein